MRRRIVFEIEAEGTENIIDSITKIMMDSKDSHNNNEDCLDSIEWSIRCIPCRVGGHRNCCIGGSVRPSMEQVRGIQELLDRLI